MKLGIHMMTHDPSTMQDYVIRTLHNLQELTTVNNAVVLSFNGTKYDDNSISEVLKAFKDVGFQDVRYIIQQDQSVLLKDQKLIKFRQNSIDLLTDCDAWLILDDDMKFGGEVLNSVSDPRSSGEQYKQMFEYMMSHPKCGVIEIASYLGTKKSPGGFVMPIRVGQNISIGRGFMVRNIDDLLAHKEIVENCIGGAEELACAVHRVKEGLYVARMTCGRTIHDVSSKFGAPGTWLDYKILCEDDFGVGKMIERYYGVKLRFVSDLPRLSIDLLAGIDEDEIIHDYRDKRWSIKA